MKIVFIGTVEFSYNALDRLFALHADVRGVVTGEKSSFNADYRNIAPLCIEHGVPFTNVTDINSNESISWIKKQKPDIIFCFGWSQLLKNDLLNLAPMGVVGYHPAELPHNRGRHPIIWALTLGLNRTASTFFFMNEWADTGDILSQKIIEIRQDDDAGSLYKKITHVALGQIESLLSALVSGTYVRISQNPMEGNAWRKREPTDGKIDWRMSAYCIHNLVRALAKPYVGAHFAYKLKTFKVWKTEIVKKVPKNIEHGKVFSIPKRGPVIKCGEDAIQLLAVEPTPDITLGEYL